MKETILFDAITNLSDVYVEEASTYVNHRPQFLKTAGWLAACLTLVVTVTMALPYMPLFRAGSAAPSAPDTTEYAKEEATEEAAPPMEAPSAEAPPQSGEPMFTIVTDTQTIVLNREGDQYTLETSAEAPETITVAFPGEVIFQANGDMLESDFDGQVTTAEVTVIPEEPLQIMVLPS